MVVFKNRDGTMGALPQSLCCAMHVLTCTLPDDNRATHQQVNGAADYITGTHVWFPMNRALAFMGPPVNAMAFHVTKGGNRFNGCYADGGRCVFEGASGLTRNVWTNGFECCAGAGLSDVNHGIILKGDTVGPGLQIYGNLFGGGSIWHEPATAPDHIAMAVPILEDGARTPSTLRAGCQFNFNISGMQCSGLAKATDASASASASACQDYCCKINGQGSCSMWQWGPSKVGGPPTCFVDPEDEELQCGPVVNGGPWVGAAWSAPPDGKAGVSDVRIEHNNFPKLAVGSRSSLSVSSKTPTDTWQFDFCEWLVFKQIELVRTITVTVSSPTTGPVSAWAQNVTGCTATIKTSAAVAGTVFAEVDSSAYNGFLV